MKFRPAPSATPKRNVLLYGPPKTGKTAGACSAPGPVALLNADLPNATWFAHSRASKDHLQELDYEGFKTIGEVQEAVNAGTLPFETVVVDPVNELYGQLLREISRNVVSPPLPAYQATSVHIERFCRALCKSPSVNAVFVCHELPVKDEGTGTIDKLPATGTTNPALGQKLMGMVDVIGYTGILIEDGGPPQYVAQLINAQGRRGGDRFDVLGSHRPTNLTEWFRAMDALTTKSGAKPEKEKETV